MLISNSQVSNTPTSLSPQWGRTGGSWLHCQASRSVPQPSSLLSNKCSRSGKYATSQIWCPLPLLLLTQLFIFTTITQLGPLTCSIFTTTRKFFTILASVLLFANPLFLRQWVGVILVFLGLLLDAFYGKSSKPGQEKVKSNGIPQAPTTV
jgi:hypothetical protein